jgi:hypothetical protein
VVAAQHEREVAVAHGAGHQLGGALAGRLDLRQVPDALVNE